MASTGTGFSLARVRLVDKNGMPTHDFLKWIQNLQSKTDQTLTLAGTIAGATSVDGMPAGLAAQLANLDANGILLANGADFARAYVNKSLDNVPNGTRAAWDSVPMKTASVDVNGNLLFKNILQASFTSGTTVASTDGIKAIPSSISITTHGKPVEITVSMGVLGGTGVNGSVVGPYIYRDGSALLTYSQIGNGWSLATNAAGTVAFSWIDNAPSAANHTYQVYASLVNGSTFTVEGGFLQLEEKA